MSQRRVEGAAPRGQGARAWQLTAGPVLCCSGAAGPGLGARVQQESRIPPPAGAAVLGRRRRQEVSCAACIHGDASAFMCCPAADGAAGGGGRKRQARNQDGHAAPADDDDFDEEEMFLRLDDVLQGGVATRPEPTRLSLSTQGFSGRPWSTQGNATVQCRRGAATNAPRAARWSAEPPWWSGEALRNTLAGPAFPVARLARLRWRRN